MAGCRLPQWPFKGNYGTVRGLWQFTKWGQCVQSAEVGTRVWAAVTSPSLEKHTHVWVKFIVNFRILQQPARRLLRSHLWNINIISVSKMVIYAHVGSHQTFSSSDLFTYDSGRCVHQQHHSSLTSFIKSCGFNKSSCSELMPMFS